jgi:putative aldouronate transport system substrate-binding protein
MQVEATQPGSFCWGLVPPGWDGGKSYHFLSPGFLGISGIPVSAAKSPDRIKELLRVLDYFAAPFGSEEYVFLVNGVEGIHYKLDKNGNIVDLPRFAKDIGSGISDLTNLTNSPPVYYFPGSADSLSDGPRMLELSRQVLPLGVQDPTLGLFSPTAIKQAGVLGTLNSDRLTGIISGRQPLSALDTWIQDWKSKGGEAMRKELEQALAAAHKK